MSVGSGGEGRGVDEEALALAAGELEGLRAAGQVARYADTLLDQLTHLRAALDTALDSRLRHQPGAYTDDAYQVPPAQTSWRWRRTLR